MHTSKSTCPRCSVRKRHIRDCGRTASYCLPCQKEYHREHYKKNRQKWKDDYEANKESRKASSRDSLARRQRRIKEIVWNWKHQPCVDCGLVEPLVIDPDHVLGVKTQNISRMIRNVVKEAELIAELTKCVPRCANCHRLKTAKEQGHYKEFLDT